MERKPHVVRNLRRSTVPGGVFRALVDAGCCGICVGRLTGVAAGLSIPQSVWENAIEEVFDGKEEAVPPQWRWNSGICVACAGILQDLCVPVHEVAPTGGGSGGMGKNRKRRHAAMLATTAVTGDGSSTPVANDSAQVPARTAPVILYPCIFPSLCDAVVTSVRSSGYMNIRDFTLSFVVPHVLPLREFVLRGIVSSALGLNHATLNKTLPVVDLRSFLRAALCDGLPQALDNAPYSSDADNADVNITISLLCPEADYAVRTFVREVCGWKKQNVLPNMSRSLDVYGGTVGFPATFPSKVLHALFDAKVQSLLLPKPTAATTTTEPGNEQKTTDSVPTQSTGVPVAQALVTTTRRPIYLAGRYLKEARGISQSPWIVDGVRLTATSVEELIAQPILAKFGSCGGVKFHSAGREDMDVRMLGDGRPFVLEIIDAKVSLPEGVCEALQEDINASTDLIEVRDLAFSDKMCFDHLKAGADSKRKRYGCVVWVSKPITTADLAKLDSMTDVVVMQDTPVRVCHRRSLMTRRKIVHSMQTTWINKHFFILELVTSAGAYVKEFVHGDRGRTVPSVGSLLDCEADILQLDVLGLIYDAPDGAGAGGSDEDDEDVDD